MADDTADSLREMAQHRGLKLVKSRRRKPGTGDFGKFGLTDEQGKPLLGIGDEGLTASAADIEDYLRAGAASTWQQSAKIVPDRPAPRGGPNRGEVDAELPAARRRPVGEVTTTQAAKPSRSSSSRSSSKREVDPEADFEPKPSPAARGRKAASRTEPEAAAPKSHSREKLAPARQLSQPKPKPKPMRVKVEPELVLRPAKPADAGALARLLRQLSCASLSEDGVARSLAALRKAGAGIFIAELGAVIGCVGWALVPTLQHGPLGRITVVIVDEEHRRQGIGTQLLAQAEAALAKRGCAVIEAMSDIEIKNAHNFFRTLKFEQTSYRFARKIVR